MLGRWVAAEKRARGCCCGVLECTPLHPLVVADAVACTHVTCGVHEPLLGCARVAWHGDRHPPKVLPLLGRPVCVWCG